MQGDVDVNQRKGKVITIFDVKVQLEYEGSCPGEENVTGGITIPEVAHDTTEDEYVVCYYSSSRCPLAWLVIAHRCESQFEISIHDESKSKQPVKELIRSGLLPKLRHQLSTLGPELVEHHGKDLQHPPDAVIGSPNAFDKRDAFVPLQSAARATSSSTSKGNSINTTSLVDDSEYRTTADELYKTFTDPARIAAFTREAPKVFEGAAAGSKFELFGGNVVGSYLELQEPTKIVQKWRLKQWPDGHFSKLSIYFDQNNADQVTTMRVRWEGIPVGQEEVTKRNWGEYYVRSIKTTFGFVKTFSARYYFTR